MGSFKGILFKWPGPSQIHRRKLSGNARGRHPRQVWVFIILDKDNNDCYITRVRDRTAVTLHAIIRAKIRNMTEIWTDRWSAYATANGKLALFQPFYVF